ncbi:XK-related protein 8 [Mactra antiquata]
MYRTNNTSTYEDLLNGHNSSEHKNDKIVAEYSTVLNNRPPYKELKENKLTVSDDDFDFFDEKINTNDECDNEDWLMDENSETNRENDIITAQPDSEINKLSPYIELTENVDDINETLTTDRVNRNIEHSTTDIDNIVRNASTVDLDNNKDINETSDLLGDDTNNSCSINNVSENRSDVADEELNLGLNKDKKRDNVDIPEDIPDGNWIERETFMVDEVDTSHDINPYIDKPRTLWDQIKYIFNILFASAVPLVSVGIFIYDIVGDIDLAINYRTTGESTYFWITVACIVVPAILMSVVDIVWVIMGKSVTGSKYKCKDILRIVIGGLSLGRFVRACICAAHTIQGVRKPHKKSLHDTKADIKRFDESMLNFISAFTEDIIMLTTQLYLFFTGRVELVVSIHSLVGSFLGISWTYASLYRDGRKAKRRSNNLRIFGFLFFLVAALAALVARSFSIVFFLIHVKIWVSILILSLHFIGMYIWLWRQQKSDVTEINQTCAKRLYLLFFAYVSIYNFINVKNGAAFTRMVVFYVILYIESAIMAGVAFSSIQQSGNNERSYYLLSLPVGFLVHVIFQGLYYTCFHANFTASCRYDIDV